MRARLVVPLVVVCALVAAAPALALPHLTKAQNRMIANLVERWVNDVVRGRNLADGWKIAGPVERGAITHKAWLSGRELPVQQMRVRNNPRTAWSVTWKSGNEIGLVVQLMTGRGKDAQMIAHEMTLLKRGGQWWVNAFYADGIIRLGPGHSGSCVDAHCKVTGLTDYFAGGRSTGNGGATTSPIDGNWRIVVLAGFFGIPFLALLTIGLVVVMRNRQAKRAWLAHQSSRAT